MSNKKTTDSEFETCDTAQSGEEYIRLKQPTTVGNKYMSVLVWRNTLGKIECFYANHSWVRADLIYARPSEGTVNGENWTLRDLVIDPDCREWLAMLLTHKVVYLVEHQDWSQSLELPTTKKATKGWTLVTEEVAA